eukprot:3757651-Rhodomonas_salina.3
MRPPLWYKPVPMRLVSAHARSRPSLTYCSALLRAMLTCSFYDGCSTAWPVLLLRWTFYRQSVSRFAVSSPNACYAVSTT